MANLENNQQAAIFECTMSRITDNPASEASNTHPFHTESSGQTTVVVLTIIKNWSVCYQSWR
jgi:hypothetical protein